MQVEALGKHPHIVVATPGRLLDLVDDEAAPLTLSEWLCLQVSQLLASSRSVPFHSSNAPQIQHTESVSTSTCCPSGLWG